MCFRGEAEGEQEAQHGEPGADEPHPRQDERKNGKASVPRLLLLLLLAVRLPDHGLGFLIILLFVEGSEAERRHPDQSVLGQKLLQAVLRQPPAWEEVQEQRLQ